MPNNLVLPKTGSTGGSKGSVKGARSTPKVGRSTSAAVSQSSSAVSLSTSTAFATLVFGKASRVFAAFVSFHYLQDKVALPLYLFFVTAGASLFLLGLQRPWNGRRIGQRRTKKIFLAGAILALTLYTWTAGLRSAGPLRTLLVDGAELPLLYLFAIVSRRELPEKRKSRGALLMLLAYILLIWDASGDVPDIQDLEKTKLGHKAEETLQRIANKTSHLTALGQNDKQRQDAEVANRKLQSMSLAQSTDIQSTSKFALRRLLGTYKPPVPGSGRVRDAFVEGTPLRSEIGVVLVLIASVIMQSSRSFTRRLATELGGAKRHFALSLSSATLCLTPLAFASYLSSSTGALLSLSVIGGITRLQLSFGHALGFAAVGFLWLVVPYYVRAIVSTSISQRVMLQSGVVIPFVMAAATSVVLGAAKSAGGVSWILIAAFVLDTVGISMMMAPGGVKRSLSELPLDNVVGNGNEREPRSTMQ